jgi:hypothetical protein
LRCEPACDCHFEWQGGDYHLGRSCRLRWEKDESCIPIPPHRYWPEQPITQRIVSLTTQSADLVQMRTRQTQQKIRQYAMERINQLQESVCAELWTLYKETDECLPADQVPVKSIPEKLLCGPVRFEVCADDPKSDHVMRPILAPRP